MEKTREEKEAELVTLKAQMAATKAEWLGPLSDLIERINTNFTGFFASMSCAGEVSLDQGVDEVRLVSNLISFLHLASSAHVSFEPQLIAHASSAYASSAPQSTVLHLNDN